VRRCVHLVPDRLDWVAAVDGGGDREAAAPRSLRGRAQGQGGRQDSDMRLVLTADTHVPRRSRDVPEMLWNAIDAADVVVHAGDWVDKSLLDTMSARSRRLIGVYGNNDDTAVRGRLPEVARAEIAGLRMAVVHETGPKEGRERPGGRRS
jgi:uncharacterized protein